MQWLYKDFGKISQEQMDSNADNHYKKIKGITRTVIISWKEHLKKTSSFGCFVQDNYKVFNNNVWQWYSPVGGIAAKTTFQKSVRKCMT